MKDFKILKLIDRFSFIFKKLGVDYNLMRKILFLKLTMDGRRIPTVVGNTKKKENKEDKNRFTSSLWMYTLLGIILIPFVIMKGNYMFKMSIVFGVIMFIITSSLIADFSSVLLDVRDISILHTKPVKGITISAAKTMHVLIYMVYLTLAFVGPALFISLFIQGPLFFLIFLIEIILIDLLIVVFTALLYMLILRFFDGEKLRDVINYVQIILSITLTVAYQFIGRLFDVFDVNIAFNPKWWQYIIFPVWFGGPFEVILKGSRNIHFIIFTILTLVIPILSIILYSKLTPAFERSLVKLNDNSSKGKKAHKWSLNFANLICFSKEERTFYRFTKNMIKSEREFKLKVYPSLGFALIFPFVFLFNILRTTSLDQLENTKYFLYIYFFAFMVPTLVSFIKYSGKYKGAYIYKIIPLKNTAPIYRGAIKALICNLILPVYLFECIIFVFVFGIGTIPHLILVLANIILYTIICFKIYDKSLPFSESFDSANQGEGLKTIPLMLIVLALAGAHYFMTNINLGVYIFIGVSLLASFILWKISFRKMIA